MFQDARIATRPAVAPSGQFSDTPYLDASDRMGSLDGLRAIAILLVLLSHFTPEHDSNQSLASVLFKIADLGWAGVDLFFVLSGFLITGILLRARQARKPLMNFYARRLLRIVPAYYLALVIALVAIPRLTSWYAAPGAAAQAPYWLFLANFTQSGGGTLHVPFRTSHFWSLAVEMQFYLLWPLIVYRCSPRALWQISMAGLLAGCLGRAFATRLETDWTVWYMWTPLRLDGLIVGSLAALAVHQRVEYSRMRPWLLLMVAIGGAFAFLLAWLGWAATIFEASSRPFDVGLVTVMTFMLSLAFGALLLISLQRNTVSHVLSHWIFKRLALYSYGMYIVHFMLASTFEAFFGPAVIAQWIPGRDGPIYAYFCVAATLTFLIAMASYHLFEIHFLQLKDAFTDRGTRKAGRPG